LKTAARHDEAGVSAEGDDVLRPGHQQHHHVAVHVRADTKIDDRPSSRVQQPQQHQLVAGRGDGAQALVAQAAMQQDQQAGQAQAP
jgi:hypothetical protein